MLVGIVARMCGLELEPDTFVFLGFKVYFMEAFSPSESHTQNYKMILSVMIICWTSMP